MITIIQNQPVRLLHFEYPQGSDAVHLATMEEIMMGTFTKGMLSGPKLGTNGEIIEIMMLIAEDRADAFLKSIAELE